MQKLLIQTFATCASIASVLAITVTAIPRTAASSSGCSGLFPKVSCIDVVGDYLRVDYIRGGVKVNSGKKIVGHMQIRGYGFDVNTVEKTYENKSDAQKVIWSERVYLNRILPNGSEVCSRFWRKVMNHHEGVTTYYACKTIEN